MKSIESKVSMKCPVCRVDGLPIQHKNGFYIMHPGRLAYPCYVGEDTDGAQACRKHLDAIIDASQRGTRVQASTDETSVQKTLSTIDD